MENRTEEIKELDVYVGKRLREKRQKLGMTLAYVAERLSVSHQQIQKYEQAQSRISAGMLYHIGQLYGVPSQYFFDGFQAIQQKKGEKINTDIISHNLEKPLSILLVEDDPTDELLTRRALEAADHKVHIFCVHDGAQAIEFLRYKTMNVDFPRPDIVLLDLNIPKRDGQTVLKEIKRDREIQDIPVIILTNSISVQEMITVYKNQASGYISKSFDYDVFQKNMIGLVDYWSTVVVLPNTAQDSACINLKTAC
ncbi:MAG: response regulator [Alphaproteobacteria bacterium]|nr:response regulator [Alphaproteobacteria bacterium]